MKTVKSENKVKDMLEEVSPPRFVLTASKEKLKRELLESSLLGEKQPGFRNFLPVFHLRMKSGFFKYALRVVPVLGLLLVFVIFQSIPAKMSAVERLDNLEAAYLGSFIKNSVHYFKTRFVDSENSENIMVLEQWRFGPDTLRLMLSRERSGDILSHLIFKKDRFYLHTQSNSSGSIFANRGTANRDNDGQKPKIIRSEARSMIIINLADATAEGTRWKRVNIIISTDALDIFGVGGSVPGDIYAKLKTSPSIIYTGEAIETIETGNEVTLRRRVDVFERNRSPEVIAYLMEYKEELDTCMSEFLNELNSDKPLIHRLPELLRNNELTVCPGKNITRNDLKIKRIKVKEITRVEKSTGKISSISRQSFYRGKVLASHDFNFLEEYFVSFDPRLFDEKAHGLESHKIDFKNAAPGGVSPDGKM